MSHGAKHSGSVFHNIVEDSLILRIDESLYRREALLRACYWFTDRCYIFIVRPTDGILEVHLRLKHSKPSLEHPTPERLEDVAGAFANALLDHQLRQEIENETGKLRELLVAKAFAEGGLLEDEPIGDVGDPVDHAKG